MDWLKYESSGQAEDERLDEPTQRVDSLPDRVFGAHMMYGGNQAIRAT